MTKISRSINIQVDPGTVWPFLDMRKWADFSDLFAEVEMSSPEMKVGEEIRITAGPGHEKVTYTAKITAFKPAQKLEYSRTGGPLPGKSEWHISSNGKSSEVHFNNTFQDPLPEPVVKSMELTMDKFLGDLKAAVENRGSAKIGK